MRASFSSGVSRPCRTSSRSPASGPLRSSSAMSRTASGGRRSLRGPSSGAPSTSSGSSSAPVVVADARADDVGLPAGGDLLADPLPGAVEPGRLLLHGDDGAGDAAAAAGQLAQRGDLEVAVDGHRDGARDGRRGHDQDVRRAAALGAQGVALLDAEAVLLVDDDEPEVGELDALLQQRVGADHDAGAAVGDLGARLALRRRLQRAGEQGDPGAGRVAVELAGAAERPEQRADAAGVLGGEDLGGGEQRGLPAGVDDLGHGAQRDDGLAGADLALQQPVHRLVAVELGGELLPHLALALGEVERERGVDGVEQPAGRAGAARMPGSRAAARRRAARVSWRVSASSHLSRCAARSTSSMRGGPVDVEQRGGEREQAVPGADLVGQRVDDQLAEAPGGAEEQLDRLLDHPARDVLARRVDRARARGPSRCRRRRSRAGACRDGRTASRRGTPRPCRRTCPRRWA